MSRPPRPWFRLYVETFSDPKVRRLTPVQRWVWVAVLGACRESCASPALFVSEMQQMRARDLAQYAGVDRGTVRRALERMMALGMVEIDGENVIRVTNWADRQYESDNVTARTRRFRERSTERSDAVPTTPFRNAPETETDIEVLEGRDIVQRKRDEPPAHDELGHWTFLYYGGRVKRDECDVLVNHATRLGIATDDYMATVKTTRWPSEARGLLRPTPKETERPAFTYDKDADDDAKKAHDAELADDETRARTHALIESLRRPGVKGRDE